MYYHRLYRSLVLYNPLTANSIVHPRRRDDQRRVSGVGTVERTVGTSRSAGLVAGVRTVAVIIVHERKWNYVTPVETREIFVGYVKRSSCKKILKTIDTIKINVTILRYSVDIVRAIVCF